MVLDLSNCPGLQAKTGRAAHGRRGWPLTTGTASPTPLKPDFVTSASSRWSSALTERLARIGARLGRFLSRGSGSESSETRRWRLLQVESAIACNLRCVMCPWTEAREKAANKGIMQQEVWDSIRPHLPQVRSVDFTGGGEPLLQPSLSEWTAQAKSAGSGTGILTNGLLLGKEKATELMAAGLDWVCVSVDGATADVYEKIRLGSSFDRVCENLANLAELRKDRVPRIMINFVIMHLNVHQLEPIVRLAAALGVDQVNFKQCDVIRGERGKGFGLFQAKETKEVRRLRKELSKARILAAKQKVDTTASSFTPTVRAVCDQDPRDSMFIRYDGAVAPCISLAIGGPTTFLGRAVVMATDRYGRIPDQDLLELWETERCLFYRTLFQSRVQEFENAFARNLYSGSRLSSDRIREAALKAMPEAAQGCRICPYLYDI